MSEIREQVTQLFCTAVELHGHTARITGPGEVTVTGPAGATVHYLENLTRKVAAAPRQDWAALVADHVGTVVTHEEIDNADRLEDKDFTEIKALVRTRLYPDTGPEHLQCVCRPLAPGLVQRMVLDGVHTISPITHRLLQRWQVGEDDLFALGEHNTRTDGPLGIEEADFPDGAPPWFLPTGGDYTSAHARWLGDYPDVTGPAGALFTVPAELGILAAPIGGIEVLETGNILATLAAHHFANDPWPISPHLYRWFDGRIELAAYVEPTGDTLALQPSDEFLALLNQLAA